MNKNFFVYMVRCVDDSLYTGYTVDLAKRLQAHNKGKAGAKYTRARRPVCLVYSEELADKRAAQKREYQLKQLSRAEKLALVAQHDL